MAVSVFLDTSVLVAGLIDFGPQSAPAQSVMHAVAEGRVTGAATGTVWIVAVYGYFPARVTDADPVSGSPSTTAAASVIRATPSRSASVSDTFSARRPNAVRPGEVSVPSAT